MVFAITDSNEDYPNYLANISYDYNSGFRVGTYNLSIKTVQNGYIYIKACSDWYGENGSTGSASARIIKVWLE